jgi:hypothetical protein
MTNRVERASQDAITLSTSATRMLRKLDAGLPLLPWTATFITVAPIAGALADRIGWQGGGVAETATRRGQPKDHAFLAESSSESTVQLYDHGENRRW